MANDTKAKMTTSEKVTLFLSSVAIVISVVSWYTSDTRSSELKRKIIKYSVDSSTMGGDFNGSNDAATPAAPAARRKRRGRATESFDFVSKDVTVEIVNDGSLPVNGVTLSISTGVVFDPVPTATVVLKPAVDREIVKQDEVLIVRLKNPLGPKEHVSAVVTFIKDVTGKRFDDDFKLGQAYVDSEVGAGILVASLAGDTTAAARKDVK